MTYNLRMATVEDCAAMAALHGNCLPESWEREVFAGWLELPQYRLWLMEAQGEVAGFVVMRYLPPEAEIITLAVDETRRRQGIARALLEHGFALLRDEGVEHCFLEVAVTNQPAQSLYQALGFTTLSTRHVYYADGTDALVMKREV